MQVLRKGSAQIQWCGAGCFFTNSPAPAIARVLSSLPGRFVARPIQRHLLLRLGGRVP